MSKEENYSIFVTESDCIKTIRDFQKLGLKFESISAERMESICKKYIKDYNIFFTVSNKNVTMGLTFKSFWDKVRERVERYLGI